MKYFMVIIKENEIGFKVKILLERKTVISCFLFLGNVFGLL